MAKNYYWLRLKEDFFKSIPMKKLRKIAGGEIYTIIYLKMQLLSLRDEGSIYLEGVGDFAEELSLALDEEPENIKVLLQYLESVGLLVYRNPDEIFLTEVPYLIGKETDKAQMMRKLREERKQKLVTDGNNVTESSNNVTNALPDVTFCYTEKEIEKDIEIEKETPPPPHNSFFVSLGRNDHVKLTNEQLYSLISQYGKERIDLIITRLDNYIEDTGKRYQSHYDTIKEWIEEDTRKGGQC
ncbi:MAG: phage replisome organizer N-terminal domain-containing protein [Methanobrevibacter sp.]|nr:phage replisome organizer N-terminal domain-containing protein [Methanobrevibacter sp.]